VGHLSKLQNEYRDKGLTVIGITGESRETNLRYMVHNDPGFTYRVAIGSAPGYETPQFPWSVLIAADGSIAWQGSPARMSAKKHLRPLLADVREPTAMELETRTTKMLEFAERFVDDQLFVRAEIAFQAIIDTYPNSAAAATAKARIESMLAADGVEQEVAAQRAVIKFVGGADAPSPSGKRVKKAARGAAKLAKLADKYAATAPRAARLARKWSEIYLHPWD